MSTSSRLTNFTRGDNAGHGNQAALLVDNAGHGNQAALLVDNAVEKRAHQAALLGPPVDDGTVVRRLDQVALLGSPVDGTMAPPVDQVTVTGLTC